MGCKARWGEILSLASEEQYTTRRRAGRNDCLKEQRGRRALIREEVLGHYLPNVEDFSQYGLICPACVTRERFYFH